MIGDIVVAAHKQPFVNTRGMWKENLHVVVGKGSVEMQCLAQ